MWSIPTARPVAPAPRPGLAGTTGDYIPHHSFFNYWTSTANYAHTRPASADEIGWNGPANHQYDIADF